MRPDIQIDQENISHLKTQWKDYGDILFHHFEKILLTRIWSHLLKKSLMENFIFCTL